MKETNDAAAQAHLLAQLDKIAEGIGATFEPFCEVVVHDLTDPKHAIACIKNNLSGRQVGDPATELGLARILDDQYPQVLAGYPNQFSDGRRAKSSSIGIKDAKGRYVAALCLNIDISLFQSLSVLLDKFTSTAQTGAHDTLDPGNAAMLRAKIDELSAALATTPRALSKKDRKALVRRLKEEGFLEIRNAAAVVAQHLGVSRATVYGDAK
ncbi:MAG: PAS domain-containing protein [Burkholderiaceae bacterium]